MGLWGQVNGIPRHVPDKKGEHSESQRMGTRLVQDGPAWWRQGLDPCHGRLRDPSGKGGGEGESGEGYEGGTVWACVVEAGVGSLPRTSPRPQWKRRRSLPFTCSI